jgi:putative integral membrane protein (TIGR02587 family)
MSQHQTGLRIERASPGEERRRGQTLPGSWRSELDDVLRAISGAFIFATPLLYTMEMWSIGTTAELWKLLLFFGIAFLICLGLAHSRSGGFKADTSPFATIEQAVDVCAVGLVGAVVVLGILGRITVGDPLESVAGKILVQTVPLAIGASVANAIFGRRGERSRQGDEEEEPAEASRGDTWKALRADLAATFIGALFLAFSIAPTDEVEVLAAALDVPHAIALVALSLLLSCVIVFASGYSTGPGQQPGPLQNPLTETVLAYVVSLLVATAALLLFDRIEPGDPLPHSLAMVIVLGFPATIGGAAGRLVI